MNRRTDQRKQLLFILLLIVSIFLIPHLASAATYYVATNGSDSNSGTESSPFRTIKKGITILSAGDTLYVKGGTYAETVLSWITPIPDGTSWNKPITVAAFPGHTVTITPPSGTAFFWIKEAKAKYLIIDGFIIDGKNQAMHGFKFHGGATHIRVKNSEVKNSKESGILVTIGSEQPLPNYHEFINMKVHHNGSSGFDHGFYITTSYNTIEGTEVHSNAGYGIHFYSGAENTAHHNTVRYSKAYNNGKLREWSCGILLSSGEQNIAHSNIIYQNPYGLCSIYRSKNALMFNNIVYENSITGIYVGDSTNLSTGVYHNTSYMNGNYGIFIGEGSQNADIKNNVAYQNGTNIYLQPVKQTGTSTSHNLTSDPLFINPTAKDFRLKHGSQAINMGILINGIDVDHDGMNRPIGKAPDIGAYESAVDAEPPGTPKEFRVLTNQ